MNEKNRQKKKKKFSSSRSWPVDEYARMFHCVLLQINLPKIALKLKPKRSIIIH